MSDPRYRDPNIDRPPLQEDNVRSNRLNELNSANAMWGWVAGAVVLALVLMFVFTRGSVNDTTASNTAPPSATTGSAVPQSPAPPAPAAPKPAPAPSTTGSGSNQ